LCKLDNAHFAYVFDINFSILSELCYSNYAFDFKKADYQSFRNCLVKTDFSFVQNNSLTLDNKLSLFYDVL